MAGYEGSDPVVRLTIPAKAEYVMLCRLALTGLADLRSLRDEPLGELKRALSEACSNAAGHAYGGAAGQVEITYALTADSLEVLVSDEGGHDSRVRFVETLSDDPITLSQ